MAQRLRAVGLVLSIAVIHGAVEAVGADEIAYRVAPTDTLIGISRDLLADPRRWPEVAAYNRLKDPNRIAPGQVLRLPASLVRSAPLPARLASTEGEVQVDGVPAAAGAPLDRAQTVATAASGSAVVELADGSRIRIAPDSAAAVDEHARYATRRQPDPAAPTTADAGEGWFAGAMRLVKGSLEVVAAKLQRAKPLEVRAPTAVVGVRGTEFRVHQDGSSDGPTRTETIEGRVAAQGLGTGSSEVAVAQGYGAVIGADGRSIVRPLAIAPDLAAMPERFERPLVRFAVPGEARPLRVQVAADPAFERIVLDQAIEPGSDVRIAGLADGRWHLRARRVDADGLQGLDAAKTFELKARPEPPATTAPRPNAKLPVGDVALAWAENIDAASYVVEVATDPAFTAPVASSPVSGSGTRLRLDAPGRYLWRLASVRADGDRGPFGDPQMFELRAGPGAPEGGVSGDGTSLEFHWSARPGDRQQLELARDADFTDIVARAEVATGDWVLPSPGPGTVYFRYRAVEPDGYVSPWSSTLKVDVPRDWRYIWLLLLPLLGL